MDYAVRVGKNPQTIITTTPKPFPLIQEWKIKAETFETIEYKLVLVNNPFLPKSYKDAMIDQYDGTRLGRQELWGEL